MRTWPALDVGRLKPAPTYDDVGAGFSRPELLQAAFLDFDIAAIEECSADLWRVFFQSSDNRDRAAVALAQQFPDLLLTSIDVADEDWASRSQASLHAIRVGKIVVAPPWDVPQAGRLKPAPTTTDVTLTTTDVTLTTTDEILTTTDEILTTTDEILTTTDEILTTTDEILTTTDVGAGFSRPIVITIQPSMGFGTGHHATTRLCLAALQTIDLAVKSVLDVGTGSGVLAIAASLLGAGRTLGIDDDPDAIQAARENVALNAALTVEIRVADLRTMPDERFDVVLANLTGGLLIQAADRLQAFAAQAGQLILSGFMYDEEQVVLAAFSTFVTCERTQEDEWVCIRLQRR